MDEEELDKHYKSISEERNSHTKKILDSESTKIVVVAGPGTGKTFLFAKLLEKKGGETLTLTFINALVNDLSLGLFGLSEVRTLHGFSTSFLKKKFGAVIFPKLSEVIKEDALILKGEENIDFDKIFQEGEEDEVHLDFYKKRKDYYGKYYGFSDVIYALVKYLEGHKDKVPQYNQVVVDEFQDFNKVEVALIDLLAEKSPILIAGDDDQSLYVDLKKANPKHIRHKHGILSPDYVAFPLPFCSRSTKVIVDAVNDLIQSAKKEKLLGGRIEKYYQYFSCKEKDKESKENPKIVYTQKYQTSIPNFIQTEVAKIASVERKKFSVLVILPPQLKKMSLPYIVKSLKKKGFRDVSSPSSSSVKEPTLLDGLRLLLEDKDSNLAWRIVSKDFLSNEELTLILKETEKNNKGISELLSKEIKEEVKKLVSTLKKIYEEKEVKKDKLEIFFDKIGYGPYQIASEKLLDEMRHDEGGGYGDYRGIKDIPITVTTIPSSKGLSEDYVFITHFDDDYCIQDKKVGVTDKDVFNILVALTRARKKVYLISTKQKKPLLLKWIDSSRIESI